MTCARSQMQAEAEEPDAAEPSLRVPMAELETLCGLLGRVGATAASSAPAHTAAAVLSCRDEEVARLARMLEREAAARTAEHAEHCRHMYTLLAARLNVSRANSPAATKAAPATPVVRRPNGLTG
jgi:hypothetical protein